MDAAISTPREGDGLGSSPTFSHTYDINVEEFDGSVHEYPLVEVGHRLEMGEVLKAGQEGWLGPTVAIQEIDRHPDAVQTGVALAHPAIGLH